MCFCEQKENNTEKLSIVKVYHIRFKRSESKRVCITCNGGNKSSPRTITIAVFIPINPRMVNLAQEEIAPTPSTRTNTHTQTHMFALFPLSMKQKSH